MRGTLLFSLAIGLIFTKDVVAKNPLNYASRNAVTTPSLGKYVQHTVDGTVTDVNGPLPGVTVSVVGVAGSGTKTDADGKFKITAEIGATLRFTSIGYVSQDVKVTAGKVNVVLESDENTLDEVVVVGYGTQKKGNLTGAVSSINVKETLEGRPIADAGRAMQGTTPGLSITIPSGEVGSDPTIKIRGQIGSISGNNNPLILLDNVEIPSINIVNPDDIESITVLKDAAASSIYGSKAAFGVVLITTKQGSKTETNTISYSNNFSFQNPFKKYEMGTVDALRYALDAAKRVGQTSIGTMYKVDENSYQEAVKWQEKYGNSIGVNDPTLYGRDWYADATGQKYGLRTYDPVEYMIRNWAPTQQHNASLSGRTGKTSYNIGLGMLDQQGMLKTNTDKFSRYNASVRVSSDISKYLTARAGAIYSRTNKQYPYATNSLTADPWLYMYRWSPILPYGKDDQGRYYRGPEGETTNANVASIVKNYMNFNLGATVNLQSNWKVDFDYNLSNQEDIWNRPGTRFSNLADSWSPAAPYLDLSGNRLYVDAEGNFVNSTAPGAIAAYALSPFNTALGANPDHYRKNNENFMRHTINAFTTYDMRMDGGHDFKFMLGLNRVAEQTEFSWIQITELLDVKNPQLAFANGTTTGNGGKLWESQMGFFGRVNYAFQDKYLFEANLRRDGSSKFPKDLQWRWFPSFSAGWVLTQESFMDWSRSFMDQFKLRGSWGIIGDQSVANNLYVSTMKNTQSTWIGATGRDWYLSTPTAVSSLITWQDIVTLNLGADARFLNNRLGFVFDWYQRETRNMIVPAEGFSETFGAAAPRGNFGALRTRGWEFAADYSHKFENGLGINLRANISDAKSVITEYGTAQLVNGNYSGKVYGEIWGYETERLYQASDFEYDANGNYVTTIVNGKTMNKLSDPNGAYQSFLQNSATFMFGAGDVKYKDLNGDGAVDNGKQTLSDHGDLKVIGNSTPRYEYGFRLGADYKGFDFSAFFQGVGSRELWGDGPLVVPGYNAGDGAMSATLASDYWRADNTGGFYPAAFNMGVTAGGNSKLNNMHVQSRYLLDMSYLRIKNITLGYSLPKELLNKVRGSNLRVYVALENFFTWDKLNGLPLDPENVPGESMFNTTTTNYNSSRIGVGTPTFKSASFGVQLSF